MRNVFFYTVIVPMIAFCFACPASASDQMAVAANREVVTLVDTVTARSGRTLEAELRVQDQDKYVVWEHVLEGDDFQVNALIVDHDRVVMAGAYRGVLYMADQALDAGDVQTAFWAVWDLTEGQLLQASTLITEGRSETLGLVQDNDVLNLIIRRETETFMAPLPYGSNGAVALDEVVAINGDYYQEPNEDNPPPEFQEQNEDNPPPNFQETNAENPPPEYQEPNEDNPPPEDQKVNN